MLHEQFDCNAGARKANKQAGQERKHSSSVEVEESNQRTSHLSSPNPGAQCSTLLMTCQIAIMTSNGCMTKARALLDCASSTSFINERLAQRLRLPHQCKCAPIAGIGGDECELSSNCVVVFNITNSKSLDVGRTSGPHWKVEAVVMPKVTKKLASSMPMRCA